MRKKQTMLPNFRYIVSYINHWLNAQSPNMVESKVVKKLLDRILFSNPDMNELSAIESLRQSLKKSMTAIPFLELGAGSRHIGKSGQPERGGNEFPRKINEIINTAVTPGYGQLLFLFSRFFKPGVMLELGTSLGISTAYLAKGNPGGTVYTIEGNPASAEIASENFKKLGLNNISVLCGSFDEILPEILKNIDRLDFSFFDGNHRKESTLHYFDLCLQKAHSGSVFIFDDIYWSHEMTEAWEKITNHPKVFLSLDFFQMGVILFTEGMIKHQLKLRY